MSRPSFKLRLGGEKQLPTQLISWLIKQTADAQSCFDLEESLNLCTDKEAGLTKRQREHSGNPYLHRVRGPFPPPAILWARLGPDWSPHREETAGRPHAWGQG